MCRSVVLFLFVTQIFLGPFIYLMIFFQLFKGAFFYCEGANIKSVKNKSDCLAIEGNVWVNRKYNFDDLGKALMSLFVLSSRDGWVNIMYTGLDAVGVDQQVYIFILLTNNHIFFLIRNINIDNEVIFFL